MKQLRLHHVGGYTDEERDGYREIVYANLVSQLLSRFEILQAIYLYFAQIQSMQVVIEAMCDLSMVTPTDLAPSASYIMSIRVAPHDPHPPMLDPQVTKALVALWANEETQRCVFKSREFQLNDSAS